MHRAIETRYKGYRFRSRLEARWAVFFDSLGLQWEYEPEGYELGDGRRYLPDFFIRYDPGWSVTEDYPGAGFWIEVKPIAPTPDERDRLLQVVTFTKHHGNFVVGLPGENAPISVRVKPLPAPPRRDGYEALYYAEFIQAIRENGTSSAQFLIACAASRSARFEFGESGVRT